MSAEPYQDLPEADEKQLCVNCMAPNIPAAHFCIKCGAPLSSYASTGPFESIFAEGSVYRQAAERPRKLIVVLGVWLIFGSGALLGLFIIGISLASGLRSSIIVFLAGCAVLLFSLLMICKTTWNYLTRKQTDERHDT
jgi:uncharacterized paraquat-inducible protein A